MKSDSTAGTLNAILAGGLAGGAAEVLWVMTYSSATTTSSAAVAREITASVWPAAAQWASAPVLGLGIHLVLAIVLAAACVPVLLHLASRGWRLSLTVISATTALVLVWAVNFFVVLPVINPAFITLMPYGATLVSKVLFAVAMACSIQYHTARVVPHGSLVQLRGLARLPHARTHGAGCLT